jgi:HAE1 family hydrophobic/amphiphilic exporter-1
VSVVEVSIEEVIETLVIALVLVILVVFLFLQSWRATLIPLLAIPVSIIGTFIFFIPLGFTINTLTLFGFVLAIGIVVDDAIVVVEAVQHYIDEEGLSPREATIKAMKDISGPVIAIALILAAVFVPVAFIPGIVGAALPAVCHHHCHLRAHFRLRGPVAHAGPVHAHLRPMHLNALSKGLNQFFYRFNGWFARLAGSYTTACGGASGPRHWCWCCSCASACHRLSCSGRKPRVHPAGGRRPPCTLPSSCRKPPRRAAQWKCCGR